MILNDKNIGLKWYRTFIPLLYFHQFINVHVIKQIYQLIKTNNNNNSMVINFIK